MLQAACPPDARQRSDRNGVAVPACHHDTRLLTRFAPDFVRSALAQNLPASLLQGRADLAVLLRHRPADARWQDGRAGRWPSPPRQARRWSWSWLPPGNEARWPRGHTPASPKSARRSEIIRGRTPSRATEPNRGPTRALNIRSHSSIRGARQAAARVGQPGRPELGPRERGLRRPPGRLGHDAARLLARARSRPPRGRRRTDGGGPRCGRCSAPSTCGCW